MEKPLHLFQGLSDDAACKKFSEYLKAGYATTKEVRVFFDQLPQILVLLYQILERPFALSPGSPLLQIVGSAFMQDSAFFVAISTPTVAPPSYAFPLHRLPPYLARELRKGQKTTTWIDVSNISTVIFDPVVGALVFRQPIEYFLCVFASFLVRDKSDDQALMPTRGPQQPPTASRMPLFATRAPEPPGCFMFETLLLHYLRIFLPHELVLTSSPTPTVFAGILTDFWFRNEKARDRISVSTLTAFQIVITHSLANPALHQQSKIKSINSTKSLTREFEVIMSHVVTLITKVLALPAHAEIGTVETSIAIIQLWLLIIQPWKAAGIYDRICASRNFEKRPGVTPSKSTNPAKPDSISLIGLEIHPMFADVEARTSAFDESWKPYVHHYWKVYGLLRRVLCHGAVKVLASSAPKQGQSKPLAQFHGLDMLCQLMLCFTDPGLLEAMASAQAPHLTDSRDEHLFYESNVLDLEIVEGGRQVWAALKLASSNPRCPPDLFEAISVVGRQLESSRYWQNAYLAPMDMPQQSFLSSCLSRVDSFASTQPAPDIRKTFSGLAMRHRDGRLTNEGRELIRSGQYKCEVSEVCFYGSDWSKPVHGSELVPLFKFAQALAWGIDSMTYRARKDNYPITEWPRYLATWWIAASVAAFCCCGIFRSVL